MSPLKLSNFKGHLTGLSNTSRIWHFSEWYLSNGKRYKVTVLSKNKVFIHETIEKSSTFSTIAKKISYISVGVLLFALIARKYYRNQYVYTVHTKPVYHREEWVEKSKEAIEQLSLETKKKTPNLNEAMRVFDGLCKHSEIRSEEFFQDTVTQLAQCFCFYYPRPDISPIFLERDNPYHQQVLEAWRKELSVRREN